MDLEVFKRVRRQPNRHHRFYPSLFQEKMQDSVDAVMKEMEKQAEGKVVERRSSGLYEPLSAGDVMSCGNSFAAESDFSYSQAEHDGKRDSDQVIQLISCVAIGSEWSE